MSTGKPKVLVVEDDPMVRGAIARVLRDRYDIVEAANGLEGEQRLLEDPEIRLVLSDGRMPQASGRDFHERIEEELKRRQARFVLLTGNMPEEWHAYFRDKGVRVMEKPFESNDLRTAFDDTEDPSRPA